ncbi:SRPBCC domain-containing protein [Paenarthrobacter sp. NPDC058040]|uniref:SRPBCC family protein n=1 Tax=unclassified Paenarthrobacter TaxID=2634190 RepID=UPI0036D99F7E
MSTAQHTLTLTRDFDAPREKVFEAWMEPEQLTKWFGPVEVDAPLEKIIVEPRIGGVWQVVMAWTDDNGQQEAPIEAVITELDAPGLLVAKAKAAPGADHEYEEMHLEFEDLGGNRTRMHLTQGPFASEEWVEMTRDGWGTSFDKLDATLG